MSPRNFVLGAASLLLTACSAAASDAPAEAPGSVPGAEPVSVSRDGAAPDSSAKPEGKGANDGGPATAPRDAAADGAPSQSPPREDAGSLDAAAEPPTSSDGAVAPTRVVGYDGVAAFDRLTNAERDALRARAVWFIHKSVGAELTGQYPSGGGAAGLGFPFHTADTAAAFGSVRLGESVFATQNGGALGKIEEFQRLATGGVAAAVRVVLMKFCFTDIGSSTDLPALEARYTQAVDAVRAAAPQVRIVHVTPPVGREGDAWSDSENPSRYRFGQWLATAFPRDVVFDLQSALSHEAAGRSCRTSNGAPALCASLAMDSGGHPNAVGSTQGAKALLYALWLAGN